MIDLTHLEQYKENNRIEAKKALGGLPRSIWETYSAFANTLGGVILLGVAEYSDKSLHTVNLPEPERLVKEFWEIVNDSKKTSVNLLSSKNVTIENINGDNIIVITVPRAQRYDKPVYVDGNPLNTYRRNGEGDYKCTKEEYQAMVRDSAVQTQDMIILDEMMLDVFNKDSIHTYRDRMSISRPGHVWEQLDDDDFLFRLGAIGIGKDGIKHPTSAGLLMFGNEYAIVREYPHYFLDYREEYDDKHSFTDRFLSASGDWSGNVFDFYFHVYNKLLLDLKTEVDISGGSRTDDTPVHKAIREALANCLINADYYGHGGIVIIKRRDKITLTNPGDFRIEVSAAKNGGLSDPRNSILMKMFNLIDIGKRAGSGIRSIYYVWKNQGWREPKITHSYEPERTSLLLPLTNNYDKNTAVKGNGKSEIQKSMIIEYLTDHANASASELSELLDVKTSRVKKLLYELIDENIIAAQGTNRNRKYKLKS